MSKKNRGSKFRELFMQFRKTLFHFFEAFFRLFHHPCVAGCFKLLDIPLVPDIVGFQICNFKLQLCSVHKIHPRFFLIVSHLHKI